MTAARVPGSPACRGADVRSGAVRSPAELRPALRAPVRAATLAAGLLVALFACTFAHAPSPCRPAGCAVTMEQAAPAQLASAVLVPAGTRHGTPSSWTVLTALLLLAAPAPALLSRRRRDRQQVGGGRAAARWQRGPPGRRAAQLPS